ncbi:adenylate/guanylate cyclase domain-containing protein [Vitiosangium sp. GDMCC 1.1324]|uniref:adenylate/guanylate cyclase domain-containing protein n=1 Tax=Vitiosangium sp. (strain GDMCC 1.1324) TaxID=2138576 RepID=UPI000D3BA9AA|nr:adenylate/guanylate cyclase domain-containing protein [Vitiosangium sp. GDMCC 1.1324]PTL85275.1 cyclase [Vitiosangium sp. GDMCC 1.1324]
MKTANLAIVFTDIKGFTERTSRQTLEENQRLLKAHNDLLTPLFKAFGGRIIKSIGDAFLVTFESPTQAVLAGMAIQDRLWHYNRTALDSERLDVRVAINVGEVRLESHDVFGEPVNIAARVESLAEAGEVFFTEAVYLAMNKAEVPSLEVGSFELKGIPGKIRVFRVPRAPYRVETPAPVVHMVPGAESAIANEQPPFGNLALSRIPESSLVPGTDLAATAAALGSRAASVGGHVMARTLTVGGQLVERTRTVGGQLVDRTRTVIQSVQAGKRPTPPAPRMLVVGGALALVLGIGFVLSDSAAENAIEDVADASSPKEKLVLVEKARRLIAEEKDEGEKGWLFGQLDEALDAPNAAVDRYRSAVKAGNGHAKRRLIKLLEHSECRVRANAAEALGDLKVESARGELEDLAEDGGPGEEPGMPLIGCNSRKAAKRALDRLGR